MGKLFEPVPRPLPGWLRTKLELYCPSFRIPETCDPRSLGILLRKAKKAEDDFRRKERHELIEVRGLQEGMKTTQGVISAISDGWIFYAGQMGRWHPRTVTLLDQEQS